MKISLINNVTREIREVPVGYSWTTLFFGFFPALFRSDYKWAFIQFVAEAITGGLAQIFFSFTYNKYHINELINKGFVPLTERDREIIIDRNIVSKSRLNYL